MSGKASAKKASTKKTAAKRDTTKKTSPPEAMNSPRSVGIRMYNTGFGDCFLLRFPCEGGTKKVLIDCGKHRLSTCDPPIDQVVKQVLEDLEAGEAAGPRVDVLVVTHRHQDHVSGFEVDGWDKVTVGEVWMPWTEDPDDPEARHICDVQSRRATRLHKEIIPHLDLDETRRAYLLGYAGNNMKNEKAMKLLHEGFQGHPRRRFLPELERRARPGHPARPASRDDRRIGTSQHIPGVEVYALGPSRDPDVIRDMVPPSGEYYELALLDAVADVETRRRSLAAAFWQWATEGNGAVTEEPNRDAEDGATRSPFSPLWQLRDANAYTSWFAQRKLPDPLAEFVKKKRSKKDGKSTSTWADWARYVGRVADDTEMELAASLETSVNGTSLVLLFKIGRAILLFPGDAQWGTWNAIMADDCWRPLLENISFYKVGHHGSENATPLRFVEQYLPRGARAMIPTDDVKSWPMIPKDSLLDGLKKRGVGFVRSDKSDARDPKEFRRNTSGGVTLYIDIEIPC